ncbi:MAG: WG repeat-containing protein, partial [Thermoguttaceae bacterium]|nr:WG repeat-containing protein [Thermoguttaceae bacterium]
MDGGLRAFSEKRMVCRLTAGDYIYLDDYGEVVPIGKWQWAGDLISGVSVVSDGEGYGVIDKDGNYVVKPEYEWMARDEKFIAGMKYDGSVDVGAYVYV